MSKARFEHWLAGLLCVLLYVLLTRRRGEPLPLHPLACLVALPVLYLGTAIPDWDIWLLGIGRHRNPVFHSAGPYLLWRLVGCAEVPARLGWPRLAVALDVNFALGLASHMILDVIQYGDVRWLTGNTLGKLWLSAHAVLLLGIAWHAGRTARASHPSGSPA